MYHQPAILSIGEDPDSSRLLKKLLSRSGYNVRSAGTIQTALVATAARLPDLIIADLSMPGAMELCRLIKAQHRGWDVPVIVVTGAANDADRIEALLAGASDFVTRPFRPDELQMRVNTRLELSRLGKTTQGIAGGRKTEACTAEWAQREHESRFLDMANNFPGMVAALGPQGQGAFFNTCWLEFRGRSMHQELGSGWMEGLHPDDRDRLLAEYANAFETRRAWQMEYRLRHGDGEYRWILCNALPMYGAPGLSTGYLACSIDVTDVRHGRDQRLKIEQAERLMLFAAGVAHDFNNVLGAAFAELDMVAPALPSGAPARQHLQSIQSILKRASEIVGLLMSCSATDNTPALEAIDLSAIVRDIVGLMTGVLSRNTVRLICEAGAHLPAILANGPQIRRVVMNLITNAVEALGSKEGSITISTSFLRIDCDQGLMKPTGLKDGDYVSLSVADTGPGMTEETLSRALHPFFTTKAQGHGLGLAVVKDIVRSHGGVVRVSSTAGRGTTFEVFLPCASGAIREQDAAQETASVGSSSGRLISVLIVEDERMLRSATGTWLEDRGFQVLYACTGQEAVRQLLDATLHIDAVLLDLTLPDMSGVEVLGTIEESRPHAAVVLTSGQDVVDGNNLDDIAGDGKRVFLRKPYRLNDLVQTLSKSPTILLNPLSQPPERNGFTNV